MVVLFLVIFTGLQWLAFNLSLPYPRLRIAEQLRQHRL